MMSIVLQVLMKPSRDLTSQRSSSAKLRRMLQRLAVLVEAYVHRTSDLMLSLTLEVARVLAFTKDVLSTLQNV